MSLQDLREQHPELYEQLEKIADRRTIPFCYLCYRDAPSGRCVCCGTDDLMRHLPSVGVEYCYDWVIEHLLREEVPEITDEEQEEQYMEFLDSAYGDEVQIGFLTVNTGQAVKDLDPVAFRMAVSEYFSDEYYIEIDGRLHAIDDIINWADEQEEIPYEDMVPE